MGSNEATVGLAGIVCLAMVCGYAADVIATRIVNAVDVGPPVASVEELTRRALDAEEEGRIADCIADDEAALRLHDLPSTRLHLAWCESRAGKLVDALRNAANALEVGIRTNDEPLMRIARVRVEALLARVPHVTFAPPPDSDCSDLRVTFDGRPVPSASLTKRFTIDPGKHKVTAEGIVAGRTARFEQEYDVAEKAFVTVRITLTPAS